MTLQLPKHVRIVEVGPRDGLQNESITIPTELKLKFVHQLAVAGLADIEVTSFVHPQRVPQLADAMPVIENLQLKDGVRYSALVPNQKGLERALESGIKRIAVFTAASESFVQKNINMSIQQSLQTFAPVVSSAREHGLSVRGYVSTAFVCPYEGDIKPQATADVTHALLDIGVDEVSIGDTIGAAAPNDVDALLAILLKTLSPDTLALHFHDTYGTALANVMAGLQCGIQTFDSSAGGLGGCPYAPGASGNLATEDLLYLLNRLGIQTGVQLEQVVQASQTIQQFLGRPLPSKQLQRLVACQV